MSEVRRCEAMLWPRGGKRPCGHRARFETTEYYVSLCGTHANSWAREGHKVVEIARTTIVAHVEDSRTTEGEA